MSDFPILILSAGRRVEFAKLFVSDAQALGLKPKLLAADKTPELSATCAMANAAFRVPPVSSSEYADAVLDICRRNGVRLAIPTIDPELDPLSVRRTDFDKAGTLLCISDTRVVALARDKLLTSRHLAAAGAEVPRSAAAAEVLADPKSWSWPLFVKPKGGSSSVGIGIVKDEAALTLAHAARSDLLVQEVLSGPEYTINVFCTRDGVLRAAVPHLRRETRGGEVSKGITVADPALRKLASDVVKSLPGPFGALCLQAIVDRGQPKVIEINARFGGGFPLAHHAGAHFTKWLIEIASGMPCTAHDKWRAGVTMLRYDAAVFQDVASDEVRRAWSV